MEVEKVEKVPDLRPQIVPGKVGMKAALDVRPRFVWGRRPRPNGGRRRPRGRFGYYKYPVVVSRGSYPAAKPPLRAPTLDEFPVIAINPSAPTGNLIVDNELEMIARLYGGIARIRLLICARGDLMLTCGVYRAETLDLWKKHDNLLKLVEDAREKLFSDHGVEAPAVPVRFYQKF